MKVLLPQPIDLEAIILLEQKNCQIVVPPDPKPATVISYVRDVHGLILRTDVTGLSTPLFNGLMHG